jgi:DNA-binding MarR family transcriptional regulator
VNVELADRAEQIIRAWEHEQPGLPTSSIGIFTRVWQVAKLLSDERRRTLAAVGMDAATLDLLSTLRRAGRPYRLSTRELSARCLVTAGAVTQRVDRAVGMGLVRRLAAQPGTRQVFVELTRQGHAEVERAVGSLLQYEQGLADVLDADQQQDLAGLLTLLLRGLTERDEGRASATGGL